MRYPFCSVMVHSATCSADPVQRRRDLVPADVAVGAADRSEIDARTAAATARLGATYEPGGAMSRGICLVIEDDVDIAGLIGLILTREGFDVRSVRTASAALHQLRALKPALITLDLGLPDLDGLQIAKDLRELSPAPLLMITARASAADQFNGMAAGASAYLIKPFHPGELRDAVRRLCPARSST